jgi:eukaryotic-like serine/threonine-protein kinase
MSGIEPGTRIAGRFRVEALAGSGGMGAVYAAIDERSGERVALKLLTAGGPSAPQRFLREGKLLSQVAHAKVVRYVAHGVTESGVRYLAMEWLEGEDLARRLDRGPLPLRDAIAVGGQIAAGLAALHRLGIVHRDVKPSNAFLVGGSLAAIKLLDLGLARPALASGSRVTHSGNMVGTPGYMAPEQIRGERDVDPRTDVFALGCVLFECVTGRPPFGGEHAAAILARILFESAPAPSDVYPGVPEAVDRLVARMLARWPGDRPADGAAALAELSELGEGPGDATLSVVSMPSVRALTPSEQRMVSVLLTQPLGGQATVSSDAEPEVARGLEEMAKTRGAHFEVLPDGAMLAAFAGEGAATDRAVRAARTALRIRELLPEVRISVTTARALVSARSGTFSVGDAVDRAASALGAARGVAIDETTSRLLDARFEIRPHGEMRELVAERSLADETRTVLGKRTPCVGRERELGMLAGIFEECRGDSVARAVLVVGPVGMGKSRLRQEFVDRLAHRDDSVRVLLSRADPVGKGSPFAALGQALRRACSILEGEPLLLSQAKLAAEVARNVAPAERPRVTEFLAEIVGTPFAEADAPRLRAARADPLLMGDEMRRAFEDFLAAECAAQPVLLILEDLHWGDRPTVLWLDAALRNLRDRPLMVLALARPEIHELFPGLWRERDVAEIHVPELSPRASERLAREVLGTAWPANMIERVVKRAGGNPFYLEELLRGSSSHDASVLPDTVIAMVQARLSELDGDARLVLRAASVFGQVFWRSGLSSLIGGSFAGDIGEPLDVLREREFIERRAQAKFPDEEEYAFRHALVRDAAYAMLTDDDLRSGHRRAGKWLEAAGEIDSMVLAEHYELGGQLDRALDQLRRAALQALEGNDLAAALDRVEKGLAAGAAGERRAAFLLIAAEADFWRGAYRESGNAAREAWSLLPSGSRAWFAAAHAALGAWGALGEHESVAEGVIQVRETAPDEDAAASKAHALTRSAVQCAFAGSNETARELLSESAALIAKMGTPAPLLLADYHYARGVLSPGSLDALDDLRKATALALEAGNLRVASGARVTHAVIAAELGDPELAERDLVEVVATARRMGIASMNAWGRLHLGHVYHAQGRNEEARATLVQVLPALEGHADVRGRAYAKGYLAGVFLSLGRLQEARAAAEQAVDLTLAFPFAQAPFLATLARTLLSLGRNDEARAAAARAMLILDDQPSIDREAFVRLVHAETLAACGARAAALEAIRKAEGRVMARAERLCDAAWRARFLHNVAENRRTLELARAWTSGAV